MCISGAVGRGGRNAYGDVKTVQILLNLSPNATGLATPVPAENYLATEIETDAGRPAAMN
jgi:hypothetical protein